MSSIVTSDLQVRCTGSRTVSRDTPECERTRRKLKLRALSGEWRVVNGNWSVANSELQVSNGEPPVARRELTITSRAPRAM